MNKGLELIEAHHLFGIAADRLDVVVHPAIGGARPRVLRRRLGHGRPGACPTCGCRSPIAWLIRERIESGARKLDLAAVGTLTFEKPDLVRFPALRARDGRARRRAAGCRPCSTPPTRSPSRPSWRGASASAESSRVVERGCARPRWRTAPRGCRPMSTTPSPLTMLREKGPRLSWIDSQFEHC